MAMGSKVVVIVVVVMSALPSASATVMMQAMTWNSDCGDPSKLSNDTEFRVHDLSITSPLKIPGEAKANVTATLNGTLPGDVVIQFLLQANTSFDEAMIVPCVEGQGSCEFRLCDLLNVGDQSSRVTQQIVTALKREGGQVFSQCPPLEGQINLNDVTINVPSMVHSALDIVINTNNYFLTMKLLSSDRQTEYGCVRVNIPVEKACLGWLCPKDIDSVIADMRSQ